MLIIIKQPRRLVTSLLLIVLLLGAVPVAAAGPVVETVTVSITASDAPPPTRVAQRMAASVSTVSEHVLLGRTVNEIADDKTNYEKLIQEVFDRVLVGYSVDTVDITPGIATRIAVVVSPWGDVVRDVKLDVDFAGLSPEVANLLRQDLGDMQEQVGDVLVGLPIEAVDWAGGVSKAVVRELLAAKLPEFHGTFDITSGQQTSIKLALAPVGPTVQDVSVAISSRSIPNILLLQARPQLLAEAKALRGLPVAFVQRHQDYFEKKMLAAVADQSITDRYQLQLIPAITPGVDTKVLVTAETKKYSMWLEGYVDIGRREDTVSAKLHAGKAIGERDELFLEVGFMPSTVAFDVIPGWGHSFGSKTVAGVKYNISDHIDSFYLQQAVGPAASLRYERFGDDDRAEIGIRYKLHEFVSVEYRITDDENYLRLIGHL